MTHGQNITPHHLSGDGLKIKLHSTETFPLGIALDQFSNDVPAEPPTAADVQHSTTLNVIGQTVEVESYHGIYVAFHVPPDSREAHNLEVLRELSARRYSGPEVVHAFVEYANGETYLYSGGVILSGRATAYNATFLFHFRRVKVVSSDLLKAVRGDLLALA
ncbi:hypothetical protein [Caballeronia sp. AZ10_KS36]|uniref:phage tail fiber protein n=1 Tax=Caballeronia sp. AZ10_KS36 TaxID=2921757 RepID=UPI0020276F8D|nr:hypothetical protein [Caballeronia sp. AZ10_KS36]